MTEATHPARPSHERAPHDVDALSPDTLMTNEAVTGAPGTSKGTITLVHLYPREMSIYGDLGNTRCLASRIRWHGYDVDVVDHHPGDELPAQPHLLLGGGGQDSGQARVEEDLARIAPRLRELAEAGTPMLMICGMYQLFGNAFVTVDGRRLPGLGILDVTTTGGAERMIGGIVLDTPFGEVVGYENHSGATVLGDGQQPFGRVAVGFGNNGTDGTEGARTNEVFGTYLHGPVLPANPAFADALVAQAARLATGREFEPEELDDSVADEARLRQVRRLTA